MTDDRGIDLAAKLALFNDTWAPRVVARMNDYEFKLVKLQGEFVWHRHDDTDETFLVLAGEMEIGFRDRTGTLRAGELYVVPRGAEHITRARGECHARACAKARGDWGLWPFGSWLCTGRLGAASTGAARARAARGHASRTGRSCPGRRGVGGSAQGPR